MRSVEACREVGITYRQLDHWISQGWIDNCGAIGTGHKRDLDDEAMNRLRHMAVLVHQGLPASTAAEASLFLSMGVPWSLGPWLLTPPSDAALNDALDPYRQESA